LGLRRRWLLLLLLPSGVDGARLLCLNDKIAVKGLQESAKVDI
jgi:hypothetical protein